MNKESVYDNCILLVDDNAELRSMLRKTMEKEGYRRVLTAGCCEETLSLLSKERPDLIILDINLPDGDGFTLMKRIRERNDAEDIPVLFLSARDKDADRLFGLGLGADDYIVKPFLKKELLLRMHAILKRSYSYGKGDDKKQNRVFRLGTRTVDLDAATITSEKGVESLTVKELRILETLYKDRGRIVTFDDLCKAVWDAQYYTYENTVMVHMRRLREKVEEDPSAPRWIVTQRGIGYKLNSEETVQRIDENRQ